MPQEYWLASPPTTRRPQDMPEAPPAPVPFWDAVERAWTDQTHTRNLGGRDTAWQGEMLARHEAVERATGQTLPWTPEMVVQRQGEFGPSAQDWGRMVTAEEYERRIGLARLAFPELAEAAPDRAELRRRFDAAQMARRAAADEAAASGWQGALGSFVGGAGASYLDPVNASATVITGGVGAGKPLLTRMLAQAGANAGAEVLAAPVRMGEARAHGGPDYTLEDAGFDIAAGAAAGAGLELLGDLTARGWRAAARRLGGSAEPADRGLSAQIERLLDDEATLGDADDFDGAREALARGDPRPVVEPEAELVSLFDALPEGGVVGSGRQTQPASFGAPGPGGEIVGEATYHGRRIIAGRFDPLALETDAARFQYKADGDAEGVTARLRGVERWDALASGKVMVFEDADGRRFIADGHQRRGLAARLAAEGWEDAALDGYLFRAADGWTAAQVRVLAALKNIREGSGSILDAAKLFREAPGALRDRSLPVTGDFIHQARALARLDPEAFRAVVNGVIPERMGAVLGEMAGDRPELHGDLIALLKKADANTVEGGRALVQEALLDDFIATEGVQMDLFGGLPREATVIARGRIREAVMRGLKKDERLFAGLVRNADAIETGGNVLARNANEAALAVDRAAGELVSQLSLRTGPMGEAFQAAARSVTLNETTAAQAAKGLIQRIRQAVKDGDALDLERAARLTPEPPPQAAREAAASFDVPAGAGQRAQIAPKPEDEWLEAVPEPVAARLTGAEVPAELKGQDRKQKSLIDWLRTTIGARVIEDTAFGRPIRISNKGLNKTAFSISPELVDVLPALPEVLRVGRLVHSQAADAGEGSNIRAWHTLAAVVEVGDARFRVVAKVREQTDGDLYWGLYGNDGRPPNAGPEDTARGRLEADAGGDRAQTIAQTDPALNVAVEPAPDGPPPGLFDDLADEGAGLDRAIQHLTACAPGKAG